MPGVPNPSSVFLTYTRHHSKDFIRLCLQRKPKERPTVAELLKHDFLKGVIPKTDEDALEDDRKLEGFELEVREECQDVHELLRVLNLRTRPRLTPSLRRPFPGWPRRAG